MTIEEEEKVLSTLDMQVIGVNKAVSMYKACTEQNKEILEITEIPMVMHHCDFLTTLQKLDIMEFVITDRTINTSFLFTCQKFGYEFVELVEQPVMYKVKGQMFRYTRKGVLLRKTQ